MCVCVLCADCVCVCVWSSTTVSCQTTSMMIYSAFSIHPHPCLQAHIFFQCLVISQPVCIFSLSVFLYCFQISTSLSQYSVHCFMTFAHVLVYMHCFLVFCLSVSLCALFFDICLSVLSFKLTYGLCPIISQCALSLALSSFVVQLMDHKE